MSRSNITVVAGDRTFVFKPIVGPNPMISQYVDTQKGSAVLFDRLGIELRPASAQNSGTRLVHRLNFPVPAGISDCGDSQGYTATPRSAGENKAILTLDVSKISTAAQTEEFADAIIAYVALPAFKQMLIDQLIPQ